MQVKISDVELRTFFGSSFVQRFVFPRGDDVLKFDKQVFNSSFMISPTSRYVVSMLHALSPNLLHTRACTCVAKIWCTSGTLSFAMISNSLLNKYYRGVG